MRAKHRVIPGDLTTEIGAFTTRLDFAREHAGAIHIDVADGEFVGSKTLPVKKWPTLSLAYAEAHLMVNNPLPYLDDLKKAGVTRAIIHIESYFDPDELSAYAREIDILLGFAINPETDLDYIRPFLELSHHVQVMGIDPGKTGQQMLPQTPLAVSYLRRVLNQRLVITVDGGVSRNNIAELNKVGANFFVASSAIYGQQDWPSAYQELLELAES